MPFTSIAEVIATETPSKAELALIEACKAGTGLTLPIGATEATLPPEGPATPDRAIRAKLLRLLIMGGTTECGLHTAGVWLKGAQVIGTLDLRFARALGRCALDTCRFDEEPRLEQANFAELSLNGSHLPGLFAQGITVTGGVFLRNLIATGTIDVNAAHIAGQLACQNAKFNGGKDLAGNQQRALKAQGVQVGSGLFLTDSIAIGTVDVNDARITGQLACNNTGFNGGKDAVGNQQKAMHAQGVRVGAGLFFNNLSAMGAVDVSGASVTGQLVCAGATLNGGTDADGNLQTAISAQRLKVSQGIFFRDLKSITGQVFLNAAHVGDLVDDNTSWPMGRDQLFLDGFTYDRIGDGALTFAGRKEWLSRGSCFYGEFSPQPYTQFARVLRDMGHASEARKVLMERDRLLFAESHKANLTATRSGNRWSIVKSRLLYYLHRFWAWFTFVASGYGHAPQRALFVSLLCIFIGWGLFFIAWQAGVIVPNSAIILTSPDWLAAMATNPDAPAAAWAKLAPGAHYETFYSLPYALDVFVPFVSLGQENAWAATTTTPFGTIVRWFTFAYQITGWAITALGIAAITGFVQKNQPD